MTEETKIELFCETCRKTDKRPWLFDSPGKLQEHMISDFESKQPQRLRVLCQNPNSDEHCMHMMAHHRRTAYQTCMFPGCRCTGFVGMTKLTFGQRLRIFLTGKLPDTQLEQMYSALQSKNTMSAVE